MIEKKQNQRVKIESESDPDTIDLLISVFGTFLDLLCISSIILGLFDVFDFGNYIAYYIFILLIAITAKNIGDIQKI